ncbi:MAG: ABC transporter permease [Cyanobacteria bacterium NC_groundwater_1444_Ag_S-0.65um_54_12]|nr:ABC transporter permease [Cyanobacteria bacterium NC_groundwater_1444_Ag_S-0.65um_54_12]
MDLAVFLALLAATLRLATPLILGSLAGIWSERSGVINIAIEGIMLSGAFAGYVIAEKTATVIGWSLGPLPGNLLAGSVAACLTGIFLGLLHAFWSSKFRTDQIISGTAINILALGLTAYLLRLIYDVGGSPKLADTLPALLSWTVAGKHGEIAIQFTPIMLAALILAVISHFGLFHTPWGLRTQAVGEHPMTVRTLGMSVEGIRYCNLALSGAIAGLAGAFLTLEQIGQFNEGMTSGKGFIALAVMIFGRWKPLLALAAALFFGLADAAQVLLQTRGISVPAEFLEMLPYLLTIVALLGLVGRTRPPAAIGQS